MWISRSWLGLIVACSACNPASSSGPSPAPTATPASSAVAPLAAPSGAPSGMGATNGTNPRTPALSPEDASFVDARRGFGWGDRCFAEIRRGQLGWARAACDRGLSLPDLDPASRPPLLYNEGVIAEKAGDLTTARSDFDQSLALRAADNPGRSTVEKELRSVGGIVPPAAPAPVGKLECRAKNGTQTIELFVDWKDGNSSSGSLRTTPATGAAETQPITAEMVKGLVLVHPAGAPVGKTLATEQTDPTKSLQVGDYKQPWLPCE